MLLQINPQNPQPRLINQASELLRNGGIIAYPTDTTYGIGCSIFCKHAIDRIYQLKQREKKKPFSFICADLAEVARYAKVSNYAFKVLKRRLPGPFTFVLDASSIVPDLLTTKQKRLEEATQSYPFVLFLHQRNTLHRKMVVCSLEEE